jgi:Xaa-Pro aminopeptidase
VSEERADRLVEVVEERGLDGLLVTHLVNVRWATGFTGTNGLAFAGPAGRVFMTDFRYVERAQDEVSGYDQRRAPQGELAESVLALLGAVGSESGPLRLGFDDDHMAVKTWRKLTERMPEGVELVEAGGLVEELRAIKDPGEIEKIRVAARVADEAFRAVIEPGIAGRTEREVALALENEMRRLGAEEPSFPSIIAAGAHGALPHAEPRDVEIPEDTLVVVDFGARVDGYCSDCTRTVATGEISDEARSVYDLVLRAQVEALAAVRPGPEGREIDEVARDIIGEAGHAAHFGHGLGHGVGLEVHEAPRLAKSGTTPLEAGNIVTCEPGVYVPGEVGVRIEDLLVVVDGGAERISSLDKDLLIVG